MTRKTDQHPAPPPRSRAARRLAVAALAAFLVCGPLAPRSDARVFFRWSARSRTRETLTTLGGRPIYETDVLLNGGRGRLTVFGFDRSRGETVEALRGAFGAAAFPAQTGSMAMAAVRNRDRVTHLLVLGLGSAERTVVFHFDQTADEERASRERPNRNPTDIPEFPGSELTFSARDETGRAGFAVYRCAASVAATDDFFRRQLPAEGWTPGIPTAGPPPTAASAFHFGVKSDKVCCVLVHAAAPGETRITVLQKALSP